MTDAPMSRTAWLLLIGLSLLWGGSFFFNALAVTALPVLTIVWVRVALAALVLWAVIWLSGRTVRWSRGAVLACLGMGLLNNAVPFSLIVWGQGQIDSGLAAILNATTPLWAVLMLHVFTADDRLTGARVAAVGLGVAGVAVLVGPGAWSAQAPVWAQAAILGAALSYGLAAVWSRRFAGLGLPPLGIAAGQLAATSVLLAPLWLALDRPWTLAAPGWTAALAVLGLALASTALAYVLYFRILALAGPARLSLVTLLVPVSAAALGWAVLGERLGLAEALGAGLIGLGLLVMDGRLLPRLTRGATKGA